MSVPLLPVDNDIRDFVANAGVTMPSTFSWAGYGEAAQNEWESRTGRIPFLEDTADVARVYNPPGHKPAMGAHGGGEQVLPLGAGLLVCTSVTVNSAVLPTTDYHLMPLNAAVKGKPYEWIEFDYPIWGLRGTVSVLGRWGYARFVTGHTDQWQIPSEVFQACLRIGAFTAATDYLQSIFSSPSTKRTKDMELVQDSFRELGQGWGEFAERVIGRYRLNIVGL